MPPSKTEVILTGIDNWDELAEISGKRLNLRTELKCFYESQEDRRYLILTRTLRLKPIFRHPQVNAFRLSRDNWKDSSKELKVFIISYVDERLGRYLDQDHDLPRWIDSLSVAVNAEQTKATDALVIEYQQIIKSFRCTDSATFADWIWKWENFLLKAAQHRMLEVAGGRWLFDIARLMAKHNGNFTDNCRQAAESLVLKTKDTIRLLSKEYNSYYSSTILATMPRLREAAIAIQGALVHTPPNATDASKEWSIGSVAVKLRTWASSALPAQPERSSSRTGDSVPG
ncbi:hypothetical protein VCV18_012685 [Metarhizium anisopliae]